MRVFGGLSAASSKKVEVEMQTEINKENEKTILPPKIFKEGLFTSKYSLIILLIILTAIIVLSGGFYRFNWPLRVVIFY